MMSRSRAIALRRRFRRPPRKYARFYGAYKNMVGQTRGFEFQVKVGSRVSNRALYKLIHHTAGKIKAKKLPYHKRRESFSSFGELFSTQWVGVRKVMHYDIHIDYPTPFD
jgi:hypothetical protein